MKIKQVLTIALILGVGIASAQNINENKNKKTMKEYTGQPVEHLFEPLPYAYDALEPFMDALTVEIHYDRHHRNYYNQFINLIGETPYKNASMEFIFANISSLSTPIRNNAGGWFNHNFYWQGLAPNGKGQPSPELMKAIEKSFGTLDILFEQFNQKAVTQFGSGWAWILVDEAGNLVVSQTPNQDNPWMDIAQVKGKPIFTIDVWEHAYYLKFQNKRPDFVKNFRNMIDWDVVNLRYAEAVK
jgi:superoxide dismutase, Fe-Mn family